MITCRSSARGPAVGMRRQPSGTIMLGVLDACGAGSGGAVLRAALHQSTSTNGSGSANVARLGLHTSVPRSRGRGCRKSFGRRTRDSDGMPPPTRLTSDDLIPQRLPALEPSQVLKEVLDEHHELE